MIVSVVLLLCFLLSCLSPLLVLAFVVPYFDLQSLYMNAFYFASLS
jgi:hypothetical protein